MEKLKNMKQNDIKRNSILSNNQLTKSVESESPLLKRRSPRDPIGKNGKKITQKSSKDKSDYNQQSRRLQTEPCNSNSIKESPRKLRSNRFKLDISGIHSCSSSKSEVLSKEIQIARKTSNFRRFDKKSIDKRSLNYQYSLNRNNSKRHGKNNSPFRQRQALKKK